MKRIIVLIILLVASIVLLSERPTHAITGVASPDPTYIGETTNFTITVVFAPAPGSACTIEWSPGGWFGPYSTLGVCTTTPCVLNKSIVSHSPVIGSAIVRAKAGSCPDSASIVAPATATISYHYVGISLTSTAGTGAQGTHSPFPVTFSVKTTGTPIATLTSSEGRFCSSSSAPFSCAATVLGTVSTSLSLPVSGGGGMATEVVSVPASVLKQAEQRGLSVIYYERTFTHPAGVAHGFPLVQTLNMSIPLTTGASGPLSIKSIRLYFNNKSPKITVARNEPTLKASAEINYNGSGLLRGYWEVDGRFHSNVFEHLVFGRVATIKTPEAPWLPTFRMGTHRLRFVITEPAVNITLPEIIYVVTKDDEDAVKIKDLPSIALAAPIDKSTTELRPLSFSWSGKKASRYLIKFFAEDGESAFFSAYTTEPHYEMNDFVLKKYFSSDMEYLWVVYELDSDGKLKAGSKQSSFSFK